MTTFKLDSQTEKNWKSGNVSVNEYLFEPVNNHEVILKDFCDESNFKIADFSNAIRNNVTNEDYLGHAFTLGMLEANDFQKRTPDDLKTFIERFAKGNWEDKSDTQLEAKYVLDLIAGAGTNQFYFISADKFDFAHPKNKNGAFYSYYHLIIWFNDKNAKMTVCQMAME